MAKAPILRDGEAQVITVTPVSWGIARPLLSAILVLALVIEGSAHVHILHLAFWWLLVVLVAPFAVVTLTRIWRWRSHKIHVTNQRVLTEAGVLSRQKSMIELRDVTATRVDQSFFERIIRRGHVTLETSGGPIPLGRVRHPGALCRIIDTERFARPVQPLPYDTVFAFDEPSTDEFEVRPNPRRRRDPRD